MATLADRLESMRAEMKSRFIAAAHQGLAASHASPEVKQRLRDRIPEACAEEVDRWRVAAATWFPIVAEKLGLSSDQISDDAVFDYVEQTAEATMEGIRVAYSRQE